MRSIVKTETGYDVIETLTGRDYIGELYGTLTLFALILGTQGKPHLLEDRRSLLELDLHQTIGKILADESLQYRKHSAIVSCVKDLYPEDEVFKKLREE